MGEAFPEAARGEQSVRGGSIGGFAALSCVGFKGRNLGWRGRQASQVEGGISGLVNMNFVSPLSRETRLISLSGNLMQYDLGDDLSGADSSGKKAAFAYARSHRGATQRSFDVLNRLG